MKNYNIYLQTEMEKYDIDRTRYTAEIHAYTAGDAWAAWKAGRLTVAQLATWQQRHGVFFNPDGEARPA